MTFETVDGTDFGGVVTRGQFRPVSESEVGNEDKETEPVLGSETLWVGSLMK